MKQRAILLVSILMLLVAGMTITRGSLHVSAAQVPCYSDTALSFSVSAPALDQKPPCETPTPSVKCDNEDGRMDPVCLYQAQTVAVYCGDPDDGDVMLTLVKESVGVASFVVTAEQIENARSLESETPVKIASKLGITLYLLPGGELQVNGPVGADGKVFVFRWETC